MSDELPTRFRTTVVGALRAEDAGRDVRLSGWVHRTRDLGGVVFLDLRDRSGHMQVSFGPDWSPPDVIERARRLGGETVVSVAGGVVRRPAEAVNPAMPTGEIEVHATSLEVLGESATPPILVATGPTEELASEDLRLRYRYLDLRREPLQRALGMRHRALQLVRQFLSSQGFWEVDTPMLTRRTPEGARDYLVPSRVHPGEFYALPQSPQLYKQLLMVSGYDRYFQIARCLRDEDLRADRQPEFTQIDAEMAFVDEEDVFRVGEEMIAHLWRETIGVELPTPFPRLTFREAMERYGTDKPDTRFGLEIRDVTDALKGADFRIFQDATGTGGRLKGIRIPGGASLSRKELDQLADVARGAGASGALWLRRTDEGFAGQFAKALDEALGQAFAAATGMQPGDLFVLVVGRFRWLPDGSVDPQATGASEAALDALRRHLADRMGLRSGGHAWLWVTEFPLFEWDEDGRRLLAAHHPFTMPHPGDVETLVRHTGGALDGDAARALFEAGIRSRAYDAVYNGHEMASGSIRIHDPALQRHVFSALGIEESEAEAKFGFLLEAFRYGAPPHGGFAFGFDRLVMLLVGAQSLREVIAFPKTTAARALFEGAPSSVRDEELRELHIRVDSR